MNVVIQLKLEGYEVKTNYVPLNTIRISGVISIL